MSRPNSAIFPSENVSTRIEGNEALLRLASPKSTRKSKKKLELPDSESYEKSSITDSSKKEAMKEEKLRMKRSFRERTAKNRYSGDRSRVDSNSSTDPELSNLHDTQQEAKGIKKFFKKLSKHGSKAVAVKDITASPNFELRNLPCVDVQNRCSGARIPTLLKDEMCLESQAHGAETFTLTAKFTPTRYALKHEIKFGKENSCNVEVSESQSPVGRKYRVTTETNVASESTDEYEDDITDVKRFHDPHLAPRIRPTVTSLTTSSYRVSARYRHRRPNRMQSSARRSSIRPRRCSIQKHSRTWPAVNSRRSSLHSRNNSMKKTDHAPSVIVNEVIAENIAEGWEEILEEKIAPDHKYQPIPAPRRRKNHVVGVTENKYPTRPAPKNTYIWMGSAGDSVYDVPTLDKNVQNVGNCVPLAGVHLKGTTNSVPTSLHESKANVNTQKKEENLHHSKSDTPKAKRRNAASFHSKDFMITAPVSTNRKNKRRNRKRPERCNLRPVIGQPIRKHSLDIKLQGEYGIDLGVEGHEIEQQVADICRSTRIPHPNAMRIKKLSNIGLNQFNDQQASSKNNIKKMLCQAVTPTLVQKYSPSSRRKNLVASSTALEWTALVS